MSAPCWSFLVLLSCVSFGGHFTHGAISMFGVFLIEQNTISPAGLGVLFAACSLPSLFVPLLVGHFIDIADKELVIALSLFLCEIIGLILFSVAICFGLFSLAAISLLVFGIGASSIVVIQRTLTTTFFKVKQFMCFLFYKHLIFTALHMYRKAYPLLLESTSLWPTLLNYLER